jgi:putative transposase
MIKSHGRRFHRTVLHVAADLLRLISFALQSRTRLAAENVFLRKQLALYVERQVKPRRADDATRITLMLVGRLIDWRGILTIVRPDTLLRWHRKGFALLWRGKSKPRGRPRLPADLRGLIHEMAVANPLWGEERIASELLLKDSRVAANGQAVHASRGRFRDWPRLPTVEHLCPQPRARHTRL